MTTHSRAAAHAALEEEESSELSSVPSPTAGPNPEQPGIPVITPKPETTANRDSITLVNPSLYMLRTRKLNSHALNACLEIATTVGNLDIISLTVHYRDETIDPSFATVIQTDRNQLTPTKNDSINDQGTLDKTSIKYLLTPTKTISSTLF